MSSTLKRGPALAVLLIAAMGWGCDTSTDPAPATGPAQVEGSSQLLGGLLDTADGLLDDGFRLVGTTVVVVGRLGSALIGPLGGILEVQDHALRVPAGAVPHPAAFTMAVLDGRTIEVDLQAVDPETGEDVGGKGFTIPVQLALSYADARIKDNDIDDLVIVRIHPDGTREPLPSTVDRATQRVTAELDHFSKYALCRN